MIAKFWWLEHGSVTNKGVSDNDQKNWGPSKIYGLVVVVSPESAFGIQFYRINLFVMIPRRSPKYFTFLIRGNCTEIEGLWGTGRCSQFPFHFPAPSLPEARPMAGDGDASWRTGGRWDGLQ